jgi:hypothetical protein
MTLQIALLGMDGVVLASDRKLNVLNQNVNTTVMRSKIYIGDKMAACWSGEQFPSTALAEHIVTKLSPLDLRWPHPKLTKESQEIVNCKGIHGEEYWSAEAIAISVEEQPIIYDITATRDRCDCFSQPKVIKGHIANPACFFAERFFKDEYTSRFPIKRLMRLAAHVVTNGGRINPRGIEGLEVVLCSSDGFTSLSSDEITALIEWSDGLDSEIMRLLFDVV